jgi:hypothetical protein
VFIRVLLYVLVGSQTSAAWFVPQGFSAGGVHRQFNGSNERTADVRGAVSGYFLIVSPCFGSADVISRWLAIISE